MPDEHRLTLPPVTFPQRGVWRTVSQLALEGPARRAAGAYIEVRRWAGRVLTSGLLLGMTAPHGLIERSSDAWLTEGRDAGSLPCAGAVRQQERQI